MKFFRRKAKEPEQPQKIQKPLISSGLGSTLKNLFGLGVTLDPQTREELEDTLLLADAGIELTALIMQKLDQDIQKEQSPLDALNIILTDIARPVETTLVPTGDPWVVLVVGSNGVGKTTTIAKMAHYYQQQGYRPMLAAGDTFRAAATEQLRNWADRLSVPLVSQHAGADSASVIYDGIESAKARGCNILLADTAGRLHNKQQLLDELGKIERVAGRSVTSAPHQKLLVVDASTGQNALHMTDTFHSTIGLTGLIMTKLDGSAKGGTLFSLCHSYGLPVPFIGTGETIDDLHPFDAQLYVNSLLR